jgi:trans-aconitate 2-methyltransferase
MQCVTDWSGEDYAKVSGLQRTMAHDAVAALRFNGDERVLDIGCGDGFITHSIAALVPDGQIVGVDASPRMVSAAQAVSRRTGASAHFVRADARHLPFAEHFDVVVSFNALHWVPEQSEALSQIAAVARLGGRILIQMVCASERASVESVAMALTERPRWVRCFEGFTAPFVHPDPAVYQRLAAEAGLTVEASTVVDREWDFGNRDDFAQWCAVGSGAWTDRLEPGARLEFVDALVTAYEPVAKRPGLFRFSQLRMEMRKLAAT